MSSWTRRSGRTVGAAVAAILLSTTMVQAGNVLGHRAGGNNIVTFNQSALTDNIHNAAHFVDDNSIEPTDISTTLFHSDPGKEVQIYDWNYGDTGWYGRWFCQSWGAGNVCLDGRVQINLFWAYNQQQARSLVCEEVGHAVGLAHSGEDGSCMSQQWDETLLSPHDKAHLNAIY